MSIIIRLQNLPWSANSLDIRRFFYGLTIPDGGVHIVGGEKGDAFIAFANDEDARQAMARDGGLIKEGCIKLLLSSRSEMKKVIEQARNAALALKSAELKERSELDSKSGLSPTNVANNGIGNKGATEHSNVGSAGARNGNALNHDSGANERAAFYMVDKGQAIATATGNGPANMAPEAMVQPMGGLAAMYGSIGNGGAGDLGTMAPIGNQLGPMVAGASQLPSAISSADQWTVELRGLPFNIVPQEIQDFFRAIGLFVQKENIKILVDERGFTTGGAIVRMTSQRDFETSLLLNARFLGSRRIDVKPLILDAALHHPTHSFMPAQHNAPMPTFSTPPAHHPLMSTGNALPIPNTAAANLAAVAGAPSVPASFHHLPNQLLPPLDNLDRKVAADDLPDDGRRRGSTLFMKGIPFGGCNENDIKQFFAPVPVSDVLVLFEKSGKPSGDAYVEFIGETNFEAAMGRNRKYMGHRYIELFPVTRNEMRRARASNPAARAGPAGAGNGFRATGRSGVPPRRTHCIQVTGLAPTVGNPDLTDYFAQLGVPPYAVHIMLKADGLNAGEAFIEFVSSDQQRKALRRDGQILNGSRLSCQPVAYELMQNIVGLPDRRRSSSPPSTHGGRGGRFRGAGRRRLRSHSRSRSRSRSCSPSRSIDSRESADRLSGRRADTSASNDGSEGGAPVMVQMDNIPARASEDDLCLFLEEFAVQRSQIHREPTADGQPAGAAQIEFPSVQVAERAIRLKDRKYLIGRCISLKRI